jgi:XTP/dITP diphosphohydrolase
MALIFVTSNRHKFEEVREIAAKHGLELEMHDLPLKEVQADEIEEIASQSASDACASFGKPCFVEDAGLFVRALRGFPGPYSSYVFRTLGNSGLLKLMTGVKDRRAEFRSALAYCEPGSKPLVFRGRVTGSVGYEARGSGGFGFDPVFLPDKGDGRTFAEMTIAEKNELSHRAQAVKKFLKWYLEKVEGHLEPKGTAGINPPCAPRKKPF